MDGIIAEPYKTILETFEIRIGHQVILTYKDRQNLAVAVSIAFPKIPTIEGNIDFNTIHDKLIELFIIRMPNGSFILRNDYLEAVVHLRTLVELPNVKQYTLDDESIFYHIPQMPASPVSFPYVSLPSVPLGGGSVVVEKVVEKIVEVPKVVEKVVEVPKVVEKVVEKIVEIPVTAAEPQEGAVDVQDSREKARERMLSGDYNDVARKPLSESSKEYKMAKRAYPVLFRYFLKALIDEAYASLSQKEKDILEPPKDTRRGRKPIPFKERIFYLVDQVNTGKADLEYEGMMGEIVRQGYTSAPCRCTSLSKYANDSALPIFFDRLIEHSARAMNRYEHIFAIDATGFNCTTKNDYYAQKHHRKKESDWCDTHVICGVNSNIITAATVHHKYTSDELDEVIPLLERTQRIFAIDYLLGDGGYMSEEKMEQIYSERLVRMVFPIKDNTLAYSPSRGVAWNENVRLNLSEIWDDIYHPRSNVETVFSSIKNRIGETVYSHGEFARINEVYCKLVVHNLYILIVYYFVANICPSFIKVDEVKELLG